MDQLSDDEKFTPLLTDKEVGGINEPGEQTRPNIYPEKVETDYLLKVTDVAVLVGMSVQWVIETTEKLGIEPEWEYFNNIRLQHYRPDILDTLIEQRDAQPRLVMIVKQKIESRRIMLESEMSSSELQRQAEDDVKRRSELQHQANQTVTEDHEVEMRIAEVDGLLAAYSIAKIIGRSKEWTRKKLDELNFKPIKTEEYRPGITRKLHDSEALEGVWIASKSIRKSIGRLTMSQIERATGQSRRRIKSITSRYGIEPQTERHADNGLTIMTYPEETIGIVEVDVDERPKPAGDWLTRKEIANALGKKFGWVDRHIKKYKDLTEDRLDKTYKSRCHYPPHVVDMLRQEIESLDPFEEGEYLTAYSMSLALGRNQKWTKDKLKELGVKPKTMLDKAGVPRNHYLPETLTALEATSEKER
jgi:hypothetical protein